MDSLRDQLSARDNYAADTSLDLVDDDAGQDLPPVIGSDERRMQVRAYNFWASQLEDRNFPSISDLDPENAGDFGANGVLLDFSASSENPAITFLGEALAAECDASGVEIRNLSDVPSRSLLSRITDHYLQILANQAPIGFEAEFVNQRGATVLYRGILLPYSSDDETINYIFGVINWKEIADQQSSDELLLEIDQVLDSDRSPVLQRPTDLAELTDWADGPGTLAINDDESWDAPYDLSAAQAATTPIALADWLAEARASADSAREREDRSRNALYEAIGRAWDFALAAAAAPDEFAVMLSEADITSQDRAPMTPVVKLVFGVDYDKTRLAEYASALTHAQRLGLGQGELTDYLRAVDGGLKGLVANERRMRRAETGETPPPSRNEPRKPIARKLRAIAPKQFSAIAETGDEFGLIMIRRTEAGEVVMLGEVAGDIALVEKAARHLLD